MKNSKEEGMQTFDMALYDLYKAHKISYDDAINSADSKNDLRLVIKLGDENAIYGGDIILTPDEDENDGATLQIRRPTSLKL